MRKLIFICLLFITAIAVAQERVIIEGNITVPPGDDAEGITIFNKNSGRGTVSNADGNFNITAKVDDTLQFRGLQYQDFSVIVDEGVVDSRELNVVVSEAVEALPEVVVRPYDLSGNVEVDVQRIDTEPLPLPDWSAAEVVDTDWNFRPDEQTSPENAAMREQAIFEGRARRFGNLFRHIFTSRSNSHVVTRSARGEDQRQVSNIDDKIQQLYDDDFFTAHLDIPREDIYEFIYFAEDNGLTPEMLEEENELELISFLIEQSREFRRVKEEE